MSSYIIDFDKWLVHARHDKFEPLADYSESEGLSLGMEIVSNTDELCLILDIVEMTKIYGNLTGNQEIFLDEEEAASALWIAMEEHTNDIPELDNGKLTVIHKPIDDDDDWDLDEPEEDVKRVEEPHKKPKKKKGVRAKDLIGMTFCTGQKTPRAGTTFAIFTDFIEDNMGEAEFDVLVKEFIRVYKPAKSNATIDEKFASGYVRGAFNAEYIEESL